MKHSNQICNSVYCVSFLYKKISAFYSLKTVVKALAYIL